MSNNQKLFTAKMFDGREFRVERFAIRHPELYEYTMIFGPHRYRIADSETEVFHWLDLVFNKPFCPECALTGMRDSGGTHPWGEPIFVLCGCEGTTCGSHIQQGQDQLTEVRYRASSTNDKARLPRRNRSRFGK